MRVLTDNGILRECFKLSPWFLNQGGYRIDIRIHRWNEYFNGTAWMAIDPSKEDKDVTLGVDRFINPSTKVFCAAEDPGAVNVMTLVLGADAATLGLTSLTGQSVFEAIGTLLEDIVSANNLAL